MAHSILNKLRSEGKLGSCSIIISDEGSLRKRRTVFGRDVTGLSRSSIEFRGGETGHERTAIPIDSVEEIECDGTVLFRKKRRIDRIYPR